jgi:hypothetical protein
MSRRPTISPTDPRKVKFAPRLYADSGERALEDFSTPAPTLAAVRAPRSGRDRLPNSNCSESPCGAHAIQTGPLRGYPRKVPTNRKRALDLDQARGLINSFAFAETKQTPLNAHLTVSWRHAHGFEESDLARMQTRLLDRLARFLRRHDIAWTCVWVRERTPGHGLHTHILLHLGSVPSKLARAMGEFVHKSMGLAPGGACLRTAQFGPGTLRMRLGLLKYILKGLDQSAYKYLGWSGQKLSIAEALGIEDRGPQGTVDMKRCGVSENLGPAERRRAAWTERRDLAALRLVLDGVG